MPSAWKIIFNILLLFFYSYSFSQSRFSHADSVRGQLNNLRSCYDVTFYQLNLKIDLSRKRIAGSGKICYRVMKEFNIIQIDLFSEMIIDKIMHRGESLIYQRDSNAVYVRFDERQEKGKEDSITIYYAGSPHTAINSPWDGGIIWSQDSIGRPWAAMACEAIGASLWWPCKDHLSDEPDSMSMSFAVAEGLSCISNGNLTGVSTYPGENVYHWMVHYPINNYNVTFYIGHYSSFNQVYRNRSGDSLSLDYYVIDYNLPKAKKYFDCVKPMLACYEELFGPYPFYKDGYALVESPYWGMEHQGAIAYGNRFSTDMLGLDFIIVHESAHEWWGNSVSIGDHGEMWIHEAFATYAEALLLERLYDYKTSLKYLAHQKENIKNKEPILGPLHVNYHGWKDADMYYKGSWMLHTLRNAIGNDSLWFNIIKGLATDFNKSIVNTEMIIDYISKKRGADLHYFFEQYLKFINPPRFIYQIEKKRKKNLISYKWEADVKNFKMPFMILVNKSELIRLNPTTDFQTVVFHGKIKDLEFPNDLFYVDIEKK
jgi:aminopeptidase N